MKTTKLMTFATTLGLAVSFAVLAGCKSSGGANETTAAGLQASATKIEGSSGKLDAVLASLNGLVKTPTNLPVQFKEYSSSLADFESNAKAVDSKVKTMREKAGEYFKQWDEKAAMIKNEDIKKSTEARKTELQERFTKIKMSYTQLGDSYKPLVSDFKEIQTVLSTDLTSGGVKAITSAAEKTNKDAVPFKKSLEELAGHFKELGAAMSSTTAAAQAATGTNAPAPAK